MEQIAIVGAGEVGGLLAHVLARRNIASDILLIDENSRAAEGQALDITQAAPVEGFSSRLSAAADLTASTGASIVVVADPFRAPDWQSEASLMLLKRLHDLAPAALVVCAGASQCDVVERGVRELRLRRTRVIGSAPEALTAGVRALVALETGSSPNDVALSVLGIPPHHIVVAWEDATIGGFGLTRLVGEPARRRLDRQLAALWPPGPFALATAAARVIDTMLGRSPRLVTCFVGPDDSAGTRTRAAAFPVRLSRLGVTDIVLPEMSVRERVRLENAMLL